MRSFLLTSGLAALVAAAPAPAPAPQDIDFDLVYALPNPTYTISADATAQVVTYATDDIFTSALPQITSTTDAAAGPDPTGVSNNKRAASSCTALPTGYGPVATPDTVAGFQAIPDFATNALQAATPSGYTQVFSNLNASNNAYGYLGFTTFKTYDVASCAAKCNSIKGCLSFNIYYERDPSVDPGAGTDCPNPSSTTFIKCAFWGGPLTTTNANNFGQWRNKFQVVIAGSNGYVSNAIASVPGYSTALPLGNAAINAPYDSLGYDSYMGVAVFTSGPFDAALCARACSEKSAYAIAHPPTDGSPVQTCQFFNTYILYINTTTNVQGQYCAMYSESWPKSYATNVGQYRGNDHFLIQYSFAYSNATNPGAVDANAAIHQASRDVSYSTLQPFCSSYLGYSVPSTTITTTITSAPVTTTTTTTATTTTVGGTNVQPFKRDGGDPDFPDSILALMKGFATTPAVEKRALSTPAVLTKYPSSILSAACSMQATPATSTVTSITSTTTTLPLSTVTTTTTTTSTATPSPTYLSSTCGFRLKVSSSNATYDGAYVQEPDQQYYLLGISTEQYYASFDSLRYCIDSTTGYVTTPNGLYAGRMNTNWKVSQARLSTSATTGDGAMQCRIDANTLQFTCTITQFGVTYSTWYVSNNGLTQLSLGLPDVGVGSLFGNNHVLAPATVYAVFP